MDDTVYRQAAIDAIFSEPLYKSGMKKRDADEVVPAIYEKIKSLPSAQPERNKGRWIHRGCGCFECDKCGAQITLNAYTAEKASDRFRFCHHCGAPMEDEG